MKNQNLNFFLGLLLGFILTFFFIEIKNNIGGCKSLNSIIQILTRQAARWSTAAKQDDSPMIAVLHANYGTGYLWALKDIATSAQIKAATNIDMDKFTKEIVKIQDWAVLKMVHACPKYGPEKNIFSENWRRKYIKMEVIENILYL